MAKEIKEILNYDTITDKNTFKLFFICLWQWYFPKRLNEISLHVDTQYTFKIKEMHTLNTMHNFKYWRTNINGLYAWPILHIFQWPQEKLRHCFPYFIVSFTLFLFHCIFYLILNCPNYINNLNLPRNLAKLWTEIQHNAEQPIIKIVE